MAGKKKLGALGSRTVTKTGSKAKPARIPKAGNARKGGGSGGRKSASR